MKRFPNRWVGWIKACISFVSHILSCLLKNWEATFRPQEVSDKVIHYPLLLLRWIIFLESLLKHNRNVLFLAIQDNVRRYMSLICFSQMIYYYFQLLINGISWIFTHYQIIQESFWLEDSLTKVCLCWYQRRSTIDPWKRINLGLSKYNHPFDYLSMSLGGNPKSILFWDPVSENIEKKLSSWKFSYISKWGRLTLI